MTAPGIPALQGREDVKVFVDAPGADALDVAICAACDRAAAAPAGTAPIGRQL